MSRAEKLQALKDQADQRLANVDSESLQQSQQLVETLRIYQAELELQNEELLESQHRLQKQQQYYVTLFHAQPHPSFLLNALGEIVEMNRSAESLLGRPLDRKIRKSIYRYLDQDAGQWVSALLRLNNPSELSRERIRVQASGADPIPCLAIFRALPKSDQWDHQAILSLIDESDSVAIENERKLYSSVINNTQLMILTLDLDFRLTSWNRQCELVHSHFQWRPGVSLESLKLGNLAQTMGSLKSMLLDQGVPQNFEIELNSDASELTFRCSCFPLRNTLGRTIGAGLVLMDITSEKAHEREITRLAFQDNLTGLINRTLLTDRIEHLIEKHHREPTPFIVIFMDLDDFKQINDSYGHETGDHVLQEVAARLRQTFRETDTISRIGGDEFVVVVPGMHKNAIIEKLEQVQQSMKAPFRLAGLEHRFSASIGLVMFPQDAHSYSEVMQHADIAMYHSKRLGKGVYSFFDDLMASRMKERYAVLQHLKTALKRNEFTLLYQPVWTLESTPVLVGFEALLRWNNPDHPGTTPEYFVPLIEEAGLMPEVGSWILDEALKTHQLAVTQAQRPLLCTVNVSVTQFWKQDFISSLENLVGGQSNDHEGLMLEITESTLIENPEAARGLMSQVKALGIGLALDDFGTGYSSLSQLKDLPIDLLKIDKSFVDGIGTDPKSEDIIETILHLARKLDMRCIAEGVETENQEVFLRSKDCELEQGFFRAKPMTRAELLPFIAGG